MRVQTLQYLKGHLWRNHMHHEIKILGEIIVFQSKCWKRVRRYLQGVHPSRGSIVCGLSGLETLEEIDIFVPLHNFQVN